MKSTLQGILAVLVFALVSTSIYAKGTPKGVDQAAKSDADQQTVTTQVQTAYSYLIKGFAEKIQYSHDGTLVNCKGSVGTCIAVDFETGTAIVDPDGCNMGPTYIQCEKVNGQYLVPVSVIPEESIWLLHQIQQTIGQ